MRNGSVFASLRRSIELPRAIGWPTRFWKHLRSAARLHSLKREHVPALVAVTSAMALSAPAASNDQRQNRAANATESAKSASAATSAQDDARSVFAAGLQAVDPRGIVLRTLELLPSSGASSDRPILRVHAPLGLADGEGRAVASASDSASQLQHVDYDLSQFKHVLVLAVGKAAVPMAAAAESVLGALISSGHVLTKHGHSPQCVASAAAGSEQKRSSRAANSDSNASSVAELEAKQRALWLNRLSVSCAGHPVPDQLGVNGSQRILALVRQHAAPDTLVLLLLSGDCPFFSA